MKKKEVCERRNLSHSLNKNRCMQNNKPVIVIDNQPVQLWAYPVYEMVLAVARFYLLLVMIIITVRVIKLPTSKGNHYAIYENEYSIELLHKNIYI